MPKHLNRILEHLLRSAQVALLIVESGEIVGGASCVVTIANRRVTPSRIFTGLDSGILTADPTEDCIGSRNQQPRALSRTLFNGPPCGRSRLDYVFIAPRTRLEIVDPWIIARR